MFRIAFLVGVVTAFSFVVTSEADAQTTRRSRIRPTTSKIRPMNDIRPLPNRNSGRTTVFIPSNPRFGPIYAPSFGSGRYNVPNYPWVSGYPTSRLASPYRQPLNPYNSAIRVYQVPSRGGQFGNTSSHYFGNPNASQYFSR